jgi:hypothetical protein
VADNKLFYGDNLDVLRRYVRDESVDLIYLDPPFNSRQDYNVLFAEKDGTRSSSQITAFEDTWEWNLDAEHAYQEIVERGGRTVDARSARVRRCQVSAKTPPRTWVTQSVSRSGFLPSRMCHFPGHLIGCDEPTLQVRLRTDAANDTLAARRGASAARRAAHRQGLGFNQVSG